MKSTTKVVVTSALLALVLCLMSFSARGELETEDVCFSHFDEVLAI